jgi:hypothetical protein
MLNYQRVLGISMIIGMMIRWLQGVITYDYVWHVVVLSNVMWVKQCHLHNPPVITIFTGINHCDMGGLSLFYPYYWDGYWDDCWDDS